MVIRVCSLSILRFYFFHRFFCEIELLGEFNSMFIEPDHTLLEDILIIQELTAFNLSLLGALSELANHLHLELEMINVRLRLLLRL